MDKATLQDAYDSMVGLEEELHRKMALWNETMEVQQAMQAELLDTARSFNACRARVAKLLDKMSDD
jgi:hypothetical protein